MSSTAPPHPIDAAAVIGKLIQILQDLLAVLAHKHPGLNFACRHLDSFITQLADLTFPRPSGAPAHPFESNAPASTLRCTAVSPPPCPAPAKRAPHVPTPAIPASPPHDHPRARPLPPPISRCRKKSPHQAKTSHAYFVTI
ncbi:hypothetical protein SIL87_11520 [Acidiphilium acidophilum]|uniref:Uncharacterized protein n=1 Tax=Acidiphilium acidophilum TaxID=76588 RepID=A0AAW9DRX2_ACIAO|nr:hypothetical protein [Acidiphilium acidophilum]